MKHLKLFALIFISTCIISCNDDNEELTFPVSKDSVTILPDITILMNLWSGGEAPFSVTSENTEVATAVCSDNSILLITGKKIGKTKLTVRDKNNAKAVVTVNVGESGYGSFSFRVTKYQFKVDAPDITMKESIESEIRNNLPVPINGDYSMNFGIPIHLSVRYSEKSIDYLNGYFETKDGKYNFVYGENSSGRYQYQYQYRIVGGSNADELILIEDLTKTYQEKYPNAGIVSVYREQYAKII